MLLKIHSRVNRTRAIGVQGGEFWPKNVDILNNCDTWDGKGGGFLDHKPDSDGVFVDFPKTGARHIVQWPAC